MTPLERLSVLFPLCTAVSLLIGCADEDPVSSYIAPHSQGAHISAGGEQVLLGAIVPYRQQCWFFKTVGPPEVVEPERDRFRQFIQSIEFSNGETAAVPNWAAPESWTHEAGSGMRYATFQLGPAGSRLELTVIGLPTRDAIDDDYLLTNVNRWREELQLSPIDADELASGSETIPLDGTAATLVQLHGTGRGGTADPMPRRTLDVPTSPHPFITGSPNFVSRSEPSGLKYLAPDGWTEGETSGMRKAAFSVSDGEQFVEITVIDLVAEAGELLPNVNRWRKEIELDETTSEELAAAPEKISVGDAVGDYVALVGPTSANRPQTIIAGVVLYDGKSWFIKLMGDSDLAAREEARFKAFVRSVQL